MDYSVHNCTFQIFILLILKEVGVILFLIRKLITFNCGYSIQFFIWRYIYEAKVMRKMVKIKHISRNKYEDIFFIFFWDKNLRGMVVNLACYSVNRELIESTFTSPLIKYRDQKRAPSHALIDQYLVNSFLSNYVSKARNKRVLDQINLHVYSFTQK